MEQNCCCVTGELFDTGTILLDRRIDPKTRTLKQSMDSTTVTGWGISPEVQEKFDAGYVALIVIDPVKSTDMSLSGIHRTGEVVYIRKEVAKNIIARVDWDRHSFSVCDDKVVQKLRSGVAV
jgi:hypothetical protein